VFVIVDAGPGSWEKVDLANLPTGQLSAVLLTHFHSDHIGDLGEVDLNTWVAGRPGPLRVFGPTGVERVVAGYEEAFALDASYRVAHHGAELLDPRVGRLEARPVAPGPIVDEDGLVIRAFAVRHDPVTPAYGYRFDYRGRSVVVSGDTAPDAGVANAARGADVLLHEAQANHLVAMIGEAAAAANRPRVAKIMADIPSYHTSPVDAAKLANDAGVKLLVLYHLTPPPPLRLMERVYTRGVSEVRPDGWVLADDLLLVELPAEASEVRTRMLD
jgi:ribonuclease Z